MTHPRILIIDDEQDLCDILLFNLVTAGYEAEVAYSAEEALAKGVERFDLLLLDVMMPGMSGFELARQLKASEATASRPIIFLTAKDTEEDTLTGFGAGADDYISKPFSVREVMARVKAVLNRTAPHGQPHVPTIVRHQGLTMHFQQKSVSVDGENAPFTKTEFDLLWLLLTHRGTVFSRQQLLRHVWPSDVVVTDRTVDVNLTRIRKKIGQYASCIIAHIGYGYSFEA